MLGRPDHHPFFRVRDFGQFPLFEALPLRDEHSRLCPFSVFAEADFSHDSVELVIAHVVRDLVVLEAFRSRDGGCEHLTHPAFDVAVSILGVPLFVFLLIRSTIHHRFRRSVEWKGRSYKTGM